MSFNSLTKKQIKNLADPCRWWESERDMYGIKLNLTTINYHLQKLIDAGIVERIQSGRKISYKLIDDDKIFKLLIKYQDTFEDDLIDCALNWYDTDYFHKTFNCQFDNFIRCVSDILPHPYHT